jgi:hypothetical protein
MRLLEWCGYHEARRHEPPTKAIILPGRQLVAGPAGPDGTESLEAAIGGKQCVRGNLLESRSAATPHHSVSGPPLGADYAMASK